jgi:hypothetical protein
MMRWLIVAASLSALLLSMSCTTSYESKGDQAYKAAQRLGGDSQRLLQKEAYLYYRKAVKAHPDRIGRALRNHFVEVTLSRATMVLTEGSSNMDAIPLFVEDVDSVMSADVDPRLLDQFSAFLLLYADSSIANQKLFKGLELINKAIAVASDPSPAKKKLEEMTGNLAKDNFEIAEMEYEQFKAEKLTESLVRAEFRLKMALYYNSDYPGAQEFLSTVYKENKGNYSAYEAVVEDKPDKVIYNQINKYLILMAVPEISKSGSSVTAVVSLYNYSFNPLRLMAGDFRLEDENGNKYPANNSSDLKKEILDQEMEVKMTLRFSGVSGNIKKLVYECCNGEQYSEKVLY